MSPISLFLFVILESLNFSEFKSFLFLLIAPFESQITISLNPYSNNKSQTAVPAAPAPFITIFNDLSFLVTFIALIKAESTTTAVPC